MRTRRRRSQEGRPLTAIELALVLACLFFIVLVLAVALSSCALCTATGAWVFPPHANLCDARDFDPKCALDHCADSLDAGPR